MPLLCGGLRVHGRVPTSGGAIAIHFERRRYGTYWYPRWYTWVQAWLDDGWVTLGDPWPKFRPANADITREIERLAAAEKG